MCGPLKKVQCLVRSSTIITVAFGKSGGFLWLQEMWYNGSVEGADGGTVYTDNRAGIYAMTGNELRTQVRSQTFFGKRSSEKGIYRIKRAHDHWQRRWGSTFGVKINVELA